MIVEVLLLCGAVLREHSGLPHSLLDMEGPPANPLIDGVGNADAPITLPLAARLLLLQDDDARLFFKKPRDCLHGQPEPAGNFSNRVPWALVHRSPDCPTPMRAPQSPTVTLANRREASKLSSATPPNCVGLHRHLRQPSI